MSSLFMKKFHKIIVKYENISYNQNMKTIFRDLRKEKSLTQMELAKILNIDQTTVSKWEVGKAIPDYDTLQRLADFYNVSVDYLLGRENKHFVSPTFEQNTALIRLKELRESKNLTQAKLAEILGVGRTTITMYEKGAIVPPADILQKLANYFDVSVDYLLGRKESLQKEMPAGFPTDISQFENDLRKTNFPVDKWAQLTDEQKNILLSTIENFIKNSK